ncbi:ABC transporter substrate-binding protein [Sulfurospirillum sp. 1612]|uniref:ABC transporter substrate-binding protein n=1 Tax=Sulfurospirillum sp. 1612 TaxID=3094835 RepID=UPI002F947A0E
MKIWMICFLLIGATSFAKPIDRVVAIGPGALRLLVYMQVHDKIVGVEKIETKSINFSEYRSILGQKRIASLPIIGSGGAGKLPNPEMLIRLKPDVIIASFIDKKQRQLISQQTHIPIVAISYGAGYGGTQDKLDAIKQSLRKLGEVFHKEKRAKMLIDFMTQQEKELAAFHLKNQDLYIGGIGFKGAHGITSSERHYPPFELLGIQNTLSKNAKINHIIIHEEDLIRKNPPLIFLDLFGKKILLENFNNKKTLYQSLTAYQNKKIFWLLPYNFYNTNIANIYINSWIILSKLGFDIDVKAKMSDIYHAFYGKDYAKLLPSRYPIMEFR